MKYKIINSCPLKGGHFEQSDLEILNNNDTHDNYKDLLAAFRKNIKPTDRAWLAGIVDGEGCIYIFKRSKKGRGKLRACIELQSTTPVMQLNSINLLKTGNISNKGVNTTRLTLGKNHEIVAFLELIIPYLVVKKHIAKFVREYCLRRISKEPISEYDYELYDKVKESNRKLGS